GTIIFTDSGRTLILTCGHAFAGVEKRQPIALDVPAPSPGKARPARIRLLAVDQHSDLALVELCDGPLPYILPVAPAGYRPGRQLLSVGYDQMMFPAQRRPTAIVQTQGGTTYTREWPAPGRSGGALVDMERACLVGVVQGYENLPSGRGLYVSLAAIR